MTQYPVFFWTSQPKRQEAAKQKSVTLGESHAIQEFQGQDVFWQDLPERSAKNRYNHDSQYANSNKFLALADTEYDEWPDQIELLLDCEWPEMSDLKRQPRTFESRDMIRQLAAGEESRKITEIDEPKELHRHPLALQKYPGDENYYANEVEQWEYSESSTNVEITKTMRLASIVE
jgi:hypothetical protein